MVIKVFGTELTLFLLGMGINTKKCKYYLRKYPDMHISECGVEVDYGYESFCTYCGGEIKETTKEVPWKVLERLQQNNYWEN